MRSSGRSLAAGAGTIGAGLLSGTSDRRSKSRRFHTGDAALLRFPAALEILEADFWIQYNELGGIQDPEVPGGTGNPAYTDALWRYWRKKWIRYIHDNTDDEITHHTFLNAYLVSKGAAPANLDPFRTLMGSTATGVNPALIGHRLTNLTQLTIDTSWWTRYRDDSHNPDLDPNHVFPQAVPTLGVNQHTAIPRTDADTTDPNFLQAIANTAAFHFPTIEQGGNSLYPSLAQRATDVEVLRILISIGPTETMHFQTWSDKAGNAPPLTGCRSGDWCVGDVSGSGGRRTTLEQGPDHAGAMSVPGSKPSDCFDHSTNQDGRRCHGCSHVSNGHGTFHRPIAAFFAYHDPTGASSRPRSPRSWLSSVTAKLTREQKSASGRTKCGRSTVSRRRIRMWKATIFLFHKNAFRGTIHCSAEVAQHRWPSGFPSDAGHSMHRVNSILMQAPKIMIFETAANLELWPKILPHYRYIRFLERGHDRNLVIMAATRSGIPISWTSEQIIDRDKFEIHFHHLKAWTKGMRVVWTFSESGGGVLVAISHDLRFRLPPLAPIMNPIIGDFFIHSVANKTLHCMKAYVEARADKVTA